MFLLGPPGAGKTALGSAACSQLGLRFLDLPDDPWPGPQALERNLTAFAKFLGAEGTKK